ncbi:MAG: ribose 5-phosphate isomerase B [Holosporaceae bacterium]|jgi:ribose 5-phosphate isomerase B|nr:ribose 5-phosphate isomerase B [Holosporaceae bacterium]
MKIFIAADHAGFAMKQYLLENFERNMVDLGTHSQESCDYPLFAQKLTDKMLNTKGSYGVLICNTGIGMTIAANRCRGIRAALCFNEKMAELSRRHNDANIIVFGSGIVNNKKALSCLRLFLDTEFESGRHSRRLHLIDSVNSMQQI